MHLLKIPIYPLRLVHCTDGGKRGEDNNIHFLSTAKALRAGNSSQVNNCKNDPPPDEQLLCFDIHLVSKESWPRGPGFGLPL